MSAPALETRVTIISDTHFRHDEIDLPAGDLLIHCGDMFNLFSAVSQQMPQMDAWFGRQKFEQIIFTGGNHDRELEHALRRGSQPLRHAHCLRDEGIEFRGLQIFGAPWVPDLPRHAFHKRQSDLARAWTLIPPALDILVTHTPPKGILDASSRGQSLGCPALADELRRKRPRVHCFGHIHASAGRLQTAETLFINAASIESGTGRIRQPMTFTLSPRTR